MDQEAYISLRGHSELMDDIQQIKQLYFLMLKKKKIDDIEDV
jgi:hypothetical protein